MWPAYASINSMKPRLLDDAALMRISFNWNHDGVIAAKWDGFRFRAFDCAGNDNAEFDERSVFHFTRSRSQNGGLFIIAQMAVAYESGKEKSPGQDHWP